MECNYRYSTVLQKSEHQNDDDCNIHILAKYNTYSTYFATLDPEISSRNSPTLQVILIRLMQMQV